MQNLTLENLGKTIEMGDAESFVSGPGAAISESRVQREMEKQGLPRPDAIAGVGDGSFTHMLEQSMGRVNQDQLEADRAIRELVAGKSKNIHETMLAIERADISLKLMMQVRNKVIDAYKEIMRMQV